MLTTLTIGVLASVAAEAINWLNLKLTNTVLKGKASFLLAAAIALVGAAVQVVASGTPLTDWHMLGTTFAQIWTVAQAFFVFIVETFKLDVQSPEADTIG